MTTTSRILLAVTAALLLLRVPSLVQPMGPDQGLYSYIGGRILHGDLPYRDAWDQKPPAIHYVYAAFRAVSSKDVIVPAADLIATALTAALVWGLGVSLGGPIAGSSGCILFLLLSDPSFQRLGGVRVRAQCETFIALFTAAALYLLSLRTASASSRAARAGWLLQVWTAGLLLGAVFALKYNAGLYVVVAVAALAIIEGVTIGNVLALALGFVVVPGVLLFVFWHGGALNDLYQSTIAYNVHYSRETYTSRLGMAGYLFTFPIQHARVDALWFAGGLGCAVLLAAGIWRRTAWIPVAWVAAACLAIAINGSRGLPQYFVQAAPALALAAGVAGAMTLARIPSILAWTCVALLAYGGWRINDVPKYAANIWHDTQYLAGRVDRRTLLARYGGQRDSDKYSALENMDLGAMLASKTRPDETVYIFGFSPGAYVYADRRSASRFFWSRPVILDFHASDPRWGVGGLVRDLDRNRPAVIALQHHDWAPDVQDSEPFFLSQPRLSSWLRLNYHQIAAPSGFSAWERNTR